MTSDEKWDEYEALLPEEKRRYASFEDYLGANGECVCESCDQVVEYDEVDENGDCFDCSDDEGEEED